MEMSESDFVSLSPSLNLFWQLAIKYWFGIPITTVTHNEGAASAGEWQVGSQSFNNWVSFGVMPLIYIQLSAEAVAKLGTSSILISKGLTTALLTKYARGSVLYLFCLGNSFPPEDLHWNKAEVIYSSRTKKGVCWGGLGSKGQDSVVGR